MQENKLHYDDIDIMTYRSENKIITMTDKLLPFEDPIIQYPHEEFNKNRNKYLNNWESADRVVVLCGTAGLGDALSWSRVAKHLQEITDKNIVLQLQPNIQPLINQEEITCIEQVPSDWISSPKTFFISIDPFGDPINDLEASWIKPSENDEIEIKSMNPWLREETKEFDIKMTQHHLEELGKLRMPPNMFRFYDYNAIFGMNSIHDIRDKIFQQSQKPSQLLHSYYNLHLKLLTGQEYNPQKYNHKILKTPEENTLPPQDIDLLIMPDAKEGEDLNHPDQSMKMVPLKTMVESLVKVVEEKGLKSIGIVKGVSHPNYCNELYEQLQKRLDIKIELLSGSFEDLLIKFIPRSKNIFVMDSVTAYISKFAIDSLTVIDRKVNLLEYFNRQFAYEEEYAIPDVPTFSIGNSAFDQLDKVLGSLYLDQIKEMRDKLSYPKVKDLSEFLVNHLL